jgi:2-polyprenyl-3-methyl-5-hydroxy-6-metoxy-1,4-benzoquinol methylase
MSDVSSLSLRKTAMPGYFEHIRKDIAPLLPPSAKLILDVGAGTGRTAAWLRARYPGSRAIALEGNPAVQEALARNVDQAFLVNLEEALPDIGSPDLILCLDVLEHLTRPAEVLRRLTSSMAEGGTVIVSVPNIAHLSVSLPLLFKAQFEYQEAGILDRTHLRFFFRRSAVAMMNEAGLIVKRGIRHGFQGPRTRILAYLTLGLAQDHLTKQYLMAGVRARAGQRQGDIPWLRA